MLCAAAMMWLSTGGTLDHTDALADYGQHIRSSAPAAGIAQAPPPPGADNCLACQWNELARTSAGGAAIAIWFPNCIHLSRTSDCEMPIRVSAIYHSSRAPPSFSV